MLALVRDTARAATNTHPFSHFRSFEGRIGLIGFTMLLLFAMNLSSWAHEFKIGSIEVDHPYSRATPEGAKVAAGYVKILNNGTEADRLVSASASIAGKTEIHEMAVDTSGVMTMRPVETVEIPAGGSAELKPGGLHFMFFDLKEGAKEGVSFKGTLTFEKAGTVEVEFAVEATGAKSGHGSHSGHGG